MLDTPIVFSYVCQVLCVVYHLSILRISLPSVLFCAEYNFWLLVMVFLLTHIPLSSFLPSQVTKERVLYILSLHFSLILCCWKFTLLSAFTAV